MKLVSKNVLCVTNSNMATLRKKALAKIWENPNCSGWSRKVRNYYYDKTLKELTENNHAVNV